MHNFKLTNNSFFATFFEEHDFVEGEDRLCWTMAGLNKLIALGLWRREFDAPGNLKTKAMSVEAAMQLRNVRPLVQHSHVREELVARETRVTRFRSVRF